MVDSDAFSEVTNFGSECEDDIQTVECVDILDRLDQDFQKSKQQHIFQFLHDQEELNKKFDEFSLNSDDDTDSTRSGISETESLLDQQLAAKRAQTLTTTFQTSQELNKTSPKISKTSGSKPKRQSNGSGARPKTLTKKNVRPQTAMGVYSRTLNDLTDIDKFQSRSADVRTRVTKTSPVAGDDVILERSYEQYEYRDRRYNDAEDVLYSPEYDIPYPPTSPSDSSRKRVSWDAEQTPFPTTTNNSGAKYSNRASFDFTMDSYRNLPANYQQNSRKTSDISALHGIIRLGPNKTPAGRGHHMRVLSMNDNPNVALSINSVKKLEKNDLSYKKLSKSANSSNMSKHRKNDLPDISTSGRSIAVLKLPPLDGSVKPGAFVSTPTSATLTESLVG